MTGPVLDRAAAAALAERAAADDAEEAALPAVTRAAASSDDAVLWHWVGLLERAADRRDHALAAFARSLSIVPANPPVAHALARTRLEAGLPAAEAFLAAHDLAPLDGDILLGLSAARLAEGCPTAAIDGLADMCRRHPGWMAGHAELARTRWATGDRAGFLASYEHAIEGAPRDAALWNAMIGAALQAGLWEVALAAVSRARAATGGSELLDLSEAVARSETGAAQAADQAFGRIRMAHPSVEMRRVRHALRLGRLDDALAGVERGLGMPDPAAIWPYAAIAWRLADDRRLAWLEADKLVSVHDLGARLPPLARIAELLGTMHLRAGEHVDQSVRGGTQTNGALLARTEPELAAIRTVIVGAVAAHVAALPPRDARHPTLSARRDRPARFAGSWSVRLRPGGRHANHIHQEGWLSSALYIALPASEESDDPRAGWLSLGEPQAELGVDPGGVSFVEPKPGRLVLFPSWMWHGTMPFERGERLTIAFDVRYPRGA